MTEVEEIIASINGSREFSGDVRTMVADLGMTHLEAICAWCERTGTDVEYAAELVKRDPELQFALQVEGESMNVLPKTSRLPL